MRYTTSIAAALLVAGIHATPAAAQVQTAQRPLAATSAITPLPASLVPDAAPAADQAESRISARHFLVSVGIGTLVGAGTGLVVGALASDGCGAQDDWCILSYEEEVAIAGVGGAMVGAAVGAVYGLVTSPRRPRAEPAPLTVAPAAAGGVSVGLTLRH